MLIEEAFRRQWATGCPTFGNRIYEIKLPENPTAWPIGTVATISGVDGLTHSGTDGVATERFQTVSWHTTAAGAEAAGNATRAHFSGFRGLMGGAGGVTVGRCSHKLKRKGLQPELKLYAVIHDFELEYFHS